MFGRIKRFFVGTTGLTPIPIPVLSQDVISAAFAVPPGVEPYNPLGNKAKPQKTLRDTAFEATLENIRRAGKVPSMLMEAAKRAGSAIVRLFEPGEESTSALRSKDGSVTRMASLGVSSRVAANAVGDSGPDAERQQRNSARLKAMRHNLSRTNSAERAAFGEFINPLDTQGRVQQHVAMGWPGLSMSVRAMPVPEQYVDSGAEMDVGFSSGLIVMGATVERCGADRAETVERMLLRAKALDMEIPPHESGREWTIADRSDSNLFAALSGLPNSPFRVGTMAEGSPIFLRDSVISLDQISPALHTTRLTKTFEKVSARLGVTHQPGQDGPQKSVLSEKAVKALRKSGVFMDYFSYAKRRADGFEERRRIDADFEKARGLSPDADRDVQARLTRQAMEDEARRAQREAPVSWQDVARVAPDWQPGPQDVRLSKEGNGVTCERLLLPARIRTALETDMTEVSDLEGFTSDHLAAGTYKVHGGTDYSITQEDGIRYGTFALPEPGSEAVVYDQAAEDAKIKADAERRREARRQLDAMRQSSRSPI